MTYSLFIESSQIPLNIDTYNDTLYWAKRIIELGAKYIMVYRGKQLITVHSKEVE